MFILDDNDGQVVKTYTSPLPGPCPVTLSIISPEGFGRSQLTAAGAYELGRQLIALAVAAAADPAPALRVVS